MQLTTCPTVGSTRKTGSSKGFKKGQHNSTALDMKGASAYAQLSTKIAKLKKVSRKLRMSSKSASTSTTETAMTQTPVDGAGPVAHGDKAVVKLKELLIHS